MSSASDAIADAVREHRRREGLSRDEIATAARAGGAPDDFTGNVIGYIETGRRDKEGRRRREVSVDELVALATATGRSPVALLGEYAGLFGAEIDCPVCESGRSQIEATVRSDVQELDELDGVEASLAATAYTLAARIDGLRGDDLKQLPALSKELRNTLESIMVGRRAVELPTPDEDDGFDGLDQPD